MINPYFKLITLTVVEGTFHFVEGKLLGDPTACGSGPTCRYTYDRSKLKEASAVLVFLNWLPGDPSKWIPLSYSPPGSIAHIMHTANKVIILPTNRGLQINTL